MLSGSAFNALLKTLEEPPAHVVFILATTELQKLPSTIISRCQRFDFRRISTDVLVDRLAYISEREGIEYEPDALRVIARLARGGMRDAISLLELCAGTLNKITVDVVDETVGSGGRENIENTVRAIANGDFDAIFSAIDAVVRSSRDISVFWQELIAYYRDMLVLKTSSSASRYLDLTEGETKRLSAVADLFSKETLIHHCRILDDTSYAMQKSGGNNRMTAEMALVKMCDNSLDTSVDALLSRISKLEAALASGAFMSRGRPAVADLKEQDRRVDEPESKMSEEKMIEEKKADVATAEELTLRNLRGWNDIVERACESDGSSRGFLKIAKAYVGSDGKIYVKFPNDFAKGRIEGTCAKGNLLSAINMAGYSDITEAELVLGLIDGKEKISDLDEFDI
jgi:DNA polymerase-3 subunit gamma/tau